jgi:PKD repeat protein
MNKILLSVIVLLLSSATLPGAAQDTLFSANFNTPASGFTLNTTDVGSTAAGANFWVANSSYSGGNGTVTCLGFPFTFTVPTTPSQPVSIAGSPNSGYMHILSNAAQSSGITNSCFIAADGLCTNPENYFSKMSSDVSTTGYDTVTISFWWLCTGGANSYGELYYSTDAGSTWNLNNVQPQYNNNGSWSQKTISDPVWANQAQLRFGFRFVNQVATAANDPALAIDEVLITGKTSVILPVAAFSVNDTAFCEETCLFFTDLSQNNPTAWEWHFEGAVPDTSSLQNPTQICYDDTGTFDVTLIVTNASGTDTIVYSNYITVYANPPTPYINVSGDTLCTVPFMSAYQWYYNGSVVIPGAVNYCYIAIFPGSYTVQITDPNGCSAFSDPMVISSLQQLEIPSVFVWPNPATDFLYVNWSNNATPAMWELHDVSGRIVKSAAWDKLVSENKISVADLSAGTYFLRISGNGMNAFQKVIVNRQ